MTMHALSNLHFATCYYMTGVIWVIQLLHYPAFALVAEDSFVKFHARHTRVMGFVVGPVMILELVTAVALAWAWGGPWWLNAAGVAVLFGLTFLVSVPRHERLAKGASASVITSLVRTNRPRTALWTARALVFLIHQVMP